MYAGGADADEGATGGIENREDLLAPVGDEHLGRQGFGNLDRDPAERGGERVEDRVDGVGAGIIRQCRVRIQGHGTREFGEQGEKPSMV